MGLAALLRERPFSLVVSLPANDPELARAAVAAGAQALKVHINVLHRASGTQFGSLAEEREALREIQRVAGCLPVGLVAGGHARVPAGEVAEAVAMGFTTISIYAHHMPAAWLGIPGAHWMPAPDFTYTPDEIAALGRLPIAAVEASIIEPEGYGQPLTVSDLCRYRQVTDRVAQPVLVPSQRRVVPEDVPALMRTGVRGLMIGAVVTGKAPDSLAAATAAFRSAVDRL